MHRHGTRPELRPIESRRRRAKLHLFTYVVGNALFWTLWGAVSISTDRWYWWPSCRWLVGRSYSRSTSGTSTGGEGDEYTDRRSQSACWRQRDAGAIRSARPRHGGRARRAPHEAVRRHPRRRRSQLCAGARDGHRVPRTEWRRKDDDTADAAPPRGADGRPGACVRSPLSRPGAPGGARRGGAGGGGLPSRPFRAGPSVLARTGAGERRRRRPLVPRT